MFNVRLRGDYLRAVRAASALAALLMIHQFASGQAGGIEAMGRSRFGIILILFCSFEHE